MYMYRLITYNKEVIMKKSLLFLVISSLIFTIDFKLGATLKQAGYTTSKNTQDLIDGNGVIKYDDPILAINGELTQDILIGEIGLGASFEQGYRVKDESFDAVPVYGLFKLKVLPIPPHPYVNARYGKTLYQNVQGVTLTDGEFYSIGAGITVDNLEIEISAEGKDGKRNGENFINGGFQLAVRYKTY